jgi:hypothetical protein
LNSIAHGDITGAAITAIGALASSMGHPEIAVAIQIVQMILPTGNTTFEADGKYLYNASGNLVPTIHSNNGPASAVWQETMTDLLWQTQARATTLGETLDRPMGIIGERMPSVAFKTGVMYLNWRDPATGNDYSRTFDVSGSKFLVPGRVQNIDTQSPWGANTTNGFINNRVSPQDERLNREVAQDDAFFDNVVRQFNNAVTASAQHRLAIYIVAENDAEIAEISRFTRHIFKATSANPARQYPPRIPHSGAGPPWLAAFLNPFNLNPKTHQTAMTLKANSPGYKNRNHLFNPTGSTT